MIIRNCTTNGCRRHQIMVASHFNGWLHGCKRIACHRYARRVRYRVPKGTLFMFPVAYQPMNWLTITIKPRWGFFGGTIADNHKVISCPASRGTSG